MQQNANRFRQQGLGVVVITYDSVEILRDFSTRRNITIPLLSDPKSEMIRAFGILNTSVPPTHLWYGVPYPGTFIVDQNGVVKSKYFEDLYSERYSAPTILLREFGSVSGTRQTTVETKHLRFNYHSTHDVVHPGLRLTLGADFQLPPKMHVYAPGNQNYISIRLELDASPNYKALPVQYPKAEILYLSAIKERVPVYQGRFRVTQDITIATGSVLQPIIASNGELKISGKLRYQACDDQICYLPETLPLEWTLKVESLDRERVPEPIQHKPVPATEGR
ncbi:MAG: redoxin domain-containing protein [Acidobacteria bacterium]|nr:redoxin domain-containing protein [Acidobacteriota bacterium]